MELREGTLAAAKHQAIMEAATTLFLDNGYERTSIDQVAALAAVGKQTVYKHFTDKKSLFTEIVLATTDDVEGMVRLVAEVMASSADIEDGLTTLAQQFLTTLMTPRLIRLRRLIIASAGQFPELGRAWYERGFERVLATLAQQFAELSSRGVLRVAEPARAAEHFTGMLLWIPLNRAMFTGDETPFTQSELHHLTTAAVQTFLAAHRPQATTAA
ncbi:TetR/AcrR family transcriptional regulator [Actinomadura sp. 7K507]|uniref:TetR/AcrR family transcriptional regulator n=1 Tax=Actinomadura sp. 7K507 TaxID=2530365 RepID=UPI0010474789|nr:TetR/AcrR family transcriptional regulator [Actinomadura sp. 7K507]TDC81455.1 TetR/AcrR family transcriptional regulator [Actinomadura sp. 7K507]